MAQQSKNEKDVQSNLQKVVEKKPDSGVTAVTGRKVMEEQLVRWVNETNQRVGITFRQRFHNYDLQVSGLVKIRPESGQEHSRRLEDDPIGVIMSIRNNMKSELAQVLRIYEQNLDKDGNTSAPREETIPLSRLRVELRALCCIFQKFLCFDILFLIKT